MMFASHIFASSPFKTDTLTHWGSRVRWPHFRMPHFRIPGPIVRISKRRSEKRSEIKQPDIAIAHAEPNVSPLQRPVINTPASGSSGMFSLAAMLAAQTAPERQESQPQEPQLNSAGPERTSCRRRFGLFRRHRCNEKSYRHAKRLPPYLRRFARRLRLGAEQRDQLLVLVNQARILRSEFKQRARGETVQWRNLISTEHFDSAAAMQLLRGHGHWWDEQLTALLAQYAELHASLDIAQRERLLQGLNRFCR